MGKHWQLVNQECLPSQVNCASYQPSTNFGADVYSDWSRVVLVLPPHTWYVLVKVTSIHVFSYCSHKHSLHPTLTLVTQLYQSIKLPSHILVGCTQVHKSAMWYAHQ